jgi:hypothetical protein
MVVKARVFEKDRKKSESRKERMADTEILRLCVHDTVGHYVHMKYSKQYFTADLTHSCR